MSQTDAKLEQLEKELKESNSKVSPLVSFKSNQIHI